MKPASMFSPPPHNPHIGQSNTRENHFFLVEACNATNGRDLIKRNGYFFFLVFFS